MTSGSKLLDRHFDKWIPEPNSGCYLWVASVRGRLSSGLRPVIKVDGKMQYVARVVCEETHGPLSGGDVARHFNCGNHMCVNFEHIKPGTQSDNEMDKSEATRKTNGDRLRRYSASLTPEQRKALSVHANRSKQSGA